MIVLLSSVRFEPFPVLVDRHLFGWKRFNQRKGILGRAVEPNIVIFRRQDHRHPVWMHLAHQFIGFCRNDRGRHQRPFFLSVLAFEKPPNTRKHKRRSRFVAFQPKPKIRRRFFPFGLAKTGCWDETTPRFKAGFPKSRSQQLIVTRIVHGLGLNRISRHLGFLRQHETPMRIFQPTRTLAIERDDRGVTLWENRRQWLRISKLIICRLNVEQTPHRLLRQVVGVEIAHFSGPGFDLHNEILGRRTQASDQL